MISPSNLIRIELGGEDEDIKGTEPVVVPSVDKGTEDTGGDIEEDRPVEPESEKKKESPQERTERVLAEMTIKANCPGTGHKGHEQVIHFQDVMIRRKGAKTSLPSRRYFPVCSFCGLRQKYVKAETLSDDVKENATLYEVK
jgi:hypothetical protein